MHFAQMVEGDRNSTFFHSVLKMYKKATNICFLRIGENLVDNTEEILEHILGYYEELFFGESRLSG